MLAIDGPSGSGKSSITQIISQKLGLTHIDTGAMFRALGYHFDSMGVSVDQVSKNHLKEVALNYIGEEEHLIDLNGVDLTHKIREHFVSKLASDYSKNHHIREYLKEYQRSLAQSKALVMEGRDIGTVIFPHAALKIFLTASPEERAKRRQHELSLKGEKTSYEQILKDVIARDKQDQERDLAPLKKAEDAIELDTTQLSQNEVVNEVISLYNKRKHLFEETL